MHTWVGKFIRCGQLNRYIIMGTQFTKNCTDRWYSLLRVSGAIVYFFILVCIEKSAAQESIPISFSDEGHILIKAKVNGVEGIFIVDTGAGITLLTKNFASGVEGLKKQAGNYTGFRATGERMDLDLYRADLLTIETYAQPLPLVTIIDADFGDLAGLISLMCFQYQPFTIDFENKKLVFETIRSLSQKKKNGSVIALQSEKSRGISLDVFAYFKLNDKLVLQFLLDSGAGNNIFKINAKHISTLGIDTTNASAGSKTYKPSEFNSAIRIFIYKADISRIAFLGQPGIKKENFKALFVENLIYDGVVSINWIGKQVTFNLKSDEMIVNRN